ncbi:hypothetical protein K1719_008631 [Acacia pycnantha]|nr:hypothetical protein K1719_008631 [Acacia pycnantha]
MDSRFNNSNLNISEQDDTDIAQENAAESPPSAVFNIDSFVPSTSSPKRRGYYRCSSSKGCPARKQVERSRMDPTMIVVTYACEHNHPWPASRNHQHHHKSAANNKAIVPAEPVAAARVEQEPESKEKFAELGEGSLMSTADDEFGWFGEMERTGTTPSAVMESTILTGDDTDVASMFLPMREEDESLFADLGELPECSVVFRRVGMDREEERRRQRAEAWNRLVSQKIIISLTSLLYLVLCSTSSGIRKKLQDETCHEQVGPNNTK